MARPRSRDGKIIPAASFGTTRTFDDAGHPIDTPPRPLTADHSRDCTCFDLKYGLALCPACAAAEAERATLTSTVSTPIPSPQKESPMPPTTNTTPTPQMQTPSTAIAVPAGIPIAAADWADMSESERTEAIAVYADEVRETTRDLQMEFPQIKTPTGGGLHWTLPNGDPVKEFAGVVVAKFKARAYWPLDAPLANNPPECSSVDGVTPISGKGPTGAVQCVACPYAQWDSGKEGRGQACKSRLNVFLLMEDSDIPRLLSLPPTGIRPFSRYARSLVDQKPPRPLSSLITIFGLEKKTGGQGPDYSIVAPRASLESLPYAEVRAVLSMRKQFQDAMSKRGITEAEATEAEDTNGQGGGYGTGEVIDGKAQREQAGF